MMEISTQMTSFRFIFALVLSLGLAGPAFAAAADAPVIGEETALGDFNEWLEGVRSEARSRGISESTIRAALHNLTPSPRVIELDRNQPEFTLTLQKYLNITVPPERVRKARSKMAENRDLLRVIEKKYGVQARFVVAFWGIESDFGRYGGGFSVITALATLAHDGRRSAYFRRELFNALQILDQGHIAVGDMKGSWAGAMGQCQFMPSTFLAHATDHDGDGRKDVWMNRADALASVANYLSNAGWNPDLTWGREVLLPKGFDHALAGPDHAKFLSEWRALGVRRIDGRDLPARNIKGTILLPERTAKGRKERAFLVYDNFRVILEWNRSNFFAIAVGRLADQLKGL